MSTTTPLLFRVAGPSNSGKTTWLLDLVQHLKTKDINVATIKHSHHNLDVLPDKDGHQLGRLAPNLTVGQDRLLFDQPIDTPPNLFDLVNRFYIDFDLVLVEGWRGEDIPTLLIADPPDDWTVPQGIIARSSVVQSSDYEDLPIWSVVDVGNWLFWNALGITDVSY